MSSPSGGRAEPRPRRTRTARESLLSIALLLEAVLMFFVTLTAFGLKVVPAPVAFIGGGVLLVLLLVAGRVVRYRWGVWLGWVLQVALLATGILLPAMYVVSAVFVGIWIFCFVKGRQLDNAKLEAQP